MNEVVILGQSLGSFPKFAIVKLLLRSRISGILNWYASAVDNAPGGNPIVVFSISLPRWPHRSVA